MMDTPSSALLHVRENSRTGVSLYWLIFKFPERFFGVIPIRFVFFITFSSAPSLFRMYWTESAISCASWKSVLCGSVPEVEKEPLFPRAVIMTDAVTS